MRNPVFSLLFALAVVALGLGWIFCIPTFVEIGVMPGQASPSIMLPGFVALAMGLWLTLRTILLMRLRDALLGGEGALARWRVSRSEWEAWGAHDAARSASWPTLRNKLRIAARPAPMEGVPVAIGTRAFAVGDAIVPLNVTGFSPYAIWQLCDVSIAEGPLASLEFSRYSRSRNGAFVALVRIPVGGARAQAQAAVDYFATAIPEKYKAFGRKRFPTHFQARDGDMKGATAANARQALARYANLAIILGVVGFSAWLGAATSRGGPIPPGISITLLSASIALLVLGVNLQIVAYFRRRG
jgi:hypothetical protein